MTNFLAKDSKRDRKISVQSVYLTLVIVWLIVTLALAVWWLIHGLTQAGMLAELEPLLSQKFQSQHRMILSEGLTLIGLLLLGGAGLFFLLLREYRRNDEMKVFFATFTHELKTPLASLRLQAEALEEDLEPSTNPLLGRLLQDASRLELQLDNALFLATARNSDQIHLEPVSLVALLDKIKTVFPDFEIRIARDVRVMADRRAIESLFRNIIQNARIHGGATTLSISTEITHARAKLTIQDNGKGFSGDSSAIGRLFFRHTPQSGSGVGLHLCKILVERMRGRLTVLPRSDQGFQLEISLPEAPSQ